MVMRAAIFHEPRSITTGDRPDPSIVEPTDAIVRVGVELPIGQMLFRTVGVRGGVLDYETDLAYGANKGWHGVARAGGQARLTAGSVERDVVVEDADPEALDAVDAAYRDKYGDRYASIVEDINNPEKRATTLRLNPR
ncbi:MAG: hypothetical protein JWQ18_11 [Conexibacter sp.]|nr:hypothetical protein [Conexibacter sp.]